jgi:two-component system cell cycle sensor histidine kinase/response regulator CckA
MTDARSGRKPSTNPWVRVVGPIVALALAALIELLDGTDFFIPNPPALFTITIVVAGFSGGLGPGLISALIAWTYTAYFFSQPGRPFEFTAEDLRRVVVWAIAMPFTAVLIGVLNRRVARALAEAEVAAVRQARLQERARVGEALRESERRLEEAQHMAHVGWWDRDLEAGRVTLSNETYRILGLPPDAAWHDLTRWQEQWQQLVHPEDRARTVRAAAEAQAGGPRYDLEYRVVRPGGEVRVVRSQGDVTRDDLGRPRRMFGTMQDITELRGAEEEVRLSESRFRALVDHATDAFFLSAAGGRILDVNRQACESLGYERHELVGMTPFDLDVQIDRAFLDRIEAQLDAGEVAAFDTHHRRKDGTAFPVEVRIRPFWEGGRRFGVSLARDITERKRAEQALRESQERLRLAVQATGLGPWDWDITNDAVIFSSEWKRQLGYDDDELENRFEEWESRLHPHDREPVHQALQAYLEGRRPEYAVEFRLRHKDGSYRWIYTRGTAARDATGRPTRMLGCHLDITDRKRAEQALMESHELLNAVVEGTSDAVFVKDLEGRYLLMNSAGACLLGRSVEEVIGKYDHDLFGPDAAQAIRDRDRQVMATGQPQTVEETVTAASIARTYLSSRGVQRDGQGSVIGIIGISRDITALKQLEEQLRQAQKMEAVGQLAGGVAHDFNNLLTVIIASSDLLYEELRSDDASRELVAEIQKAGTQAANLTRQLLAFSRRQVLQPRTVRLNELLADLVKLLKRLISADIELTLVTDAAAGAVRVDPGQFEQAIINLAVNARDAMPEGGALLIETHRADLDDAFARCHTDVQPGRYALVTVKDSGHGMDEATRGRIFEPFFTTKGPGHGTGLGLAMVYGFVKQSGGHIEVESEVDRGTVVRVYFPHAEEAVTPAAPTEDVVTTTGGTETILLVEDEDAVRMLLRQILESSGYVVLEAPDGQEGISVAQRHQGTIHILVTDLVMPRMSGRQLADQLTRSIPDLRILFMSGYSYEPAGPDPGLGPGIDLLQKPFSPNSLVRKVREILDRNE